MVVTMTPGTMFRRPDDSSSSEDSSEHPQDTVALSTEDSIRARINSLESGVSGTPGGPSGDPSDGPAREPSSAGQGLPFAPAALAKSASNEDVRDIFMLSLLEEKAINQAAEKLGKDKSDPDVKRMAKALYKQFTGRVFGNHPYAHDNMSHLRSMTNDGISRVMDTTLAGIVQDANAVGTATAAGTSQALVSRPMLAPDGDSRFHSIATHLDLALGFRTTVPNYLHGLEGLHTDRYRNDYHEIEMIGKGGYGKVYKVKNKLDNGFYAMKRIVFSPSKMRNIAEHGGQAQAVDNMLKEVRSLALLNHNNIVRYYSAWLDYSAEPVRPGQDPIDESGESTTTSAYGAEYSGHDEYSNIGFVFAEDSDAGAGADAETGTDTGTGAGADETTDDIDDLPMSRRAGKRKDRRTSEATLTSVTSTKSGKSVEIEDGVESEEDVELIPRSHSPTFEESSGFFSNSEMPNVSNSLVTTRHDGASLTLNIQMSLYNGSLSTFLSPEKPGPTHCYHVCISLELLGSVLTGVEYLHSEQVVHRDLKPANIFLAISSRHVQPFGSVNLASCRDCPEAQCQHITPAIGDFGLVAALGDTATKAVGTEFYRPPMGGAINEKLDVYALGIIAFELLQKFDTRMERVEALQKLRQCELPKGFAESIGGDSGKRIEAMILGMLHPDEERRWECSQVKKEVEDLVRVYRDRSSSATI